MPAGGIVKKQTTKEGATNASPKKTNFLNFRGTLQEYFQKDHIAIPIFTTKEKTEGYSGSNKLFISQCQAGTVVLGTGEGWTKKKAIQNAARDALQKMNLISPQQHFEKKETAPVTQNKQYINGNFRGALQEYMVKEDPSLGLEYKTEMDQSKMCFIATCSAVGGVAEQFVKIEGIGEGRSKKSAVHNSALDFMFKSKILTTTQHRKFHQEWNEATLKDPNLNSGTKKRDDADHQNTKEDAQPSSRKNHPLNFRGILQDYFQKDHTTIPTFVTTEKSEKNIGSNKLFISQCQAGSVVLGTGEGYSKKKAIQSAAKDALLKMKLITPQQHYKEREIKPVTQNKQYLNGNFRGALQEYLVKQDPSLVLEFTTKQDQSKMWFITICKSVEGAEGQIINIEGTGKGRSKKSSVQLSALDFMFKSKILITTQHHKFHKV